MTKRKQTEKQFRKLTDEDLKQVTGGAGIDCSLPENKDKSQCSAKLKNLVATFQGETWGVNPADPQSITASPGWVEMIE